MSSFVLDADVSSSKVKNMKKSPSEHDLFEQLIDFFNQAEIGYIASPDAPIVLTVLDGHEVLFEVTPGMVRLFLRLIEVTNEDEQAEAAALLAMNAPIPLEYLAVADYAADDGYVGLAIEVSMPRTFNRVGLIDALTLVNETITKLTTMSETQPPN